MGVAPVNQSNYKRLSDGSVWPVIAHEDDLEWRVIHAPDRLSKKDLSHVSAIIGAYRHLIHEASRGKVALVRRELKEAL